MCAKNTYVGKWGQKHGISFLSKLLAYSLTSSEQIFSQTYRVSNRLFSKYFPTQVNSFSLLINMLSKCASSFSSLCADQNMIYDVITMYEVTGYITKTYIEYS